MATIKLSNCIVTSISGSTSSCKFLVQGTPFGKGIIGPGAATRRKQILSPKARLSRAHGKRLKDRPEQIVYQGGDYCACNAYLVADWLWSHELIDRRLWRLAVKRPCFSGYDLWLFEAIGCARQGLYLPDVPSISGGYSRNNLIQGRTWQPPADCLKDIPPKIGNFIERDWWTHPTKLWKLHFYGIDPDWFPTRPFLQDARLEWYWDPTDRTELLSCTHTFDNFATATELAMSWPIPYTSGICYIHVYTTKGEHIIYQQDRGQPDGLDLPALMHCSSMTVPGYAAKGGWE